jgi:hypothetical protein
VSRHGVVLPHQKKNLVLYQGQDYSSLASINPGTVFKDLALPLNAAPGHQITVRIHRRNPDDAKRTAWYGKN